MKKIKKIGVLTSGGDAPGMNACVRAVVRTCMYHKVKTVGILEGYKGLIEDNVVTMGSKSVANIIQRGGTILKSARSMEFMTKEGRAKAYDTLIKNKIDALIVIGGNGTFTGASVFMSEYDFPIIGAPGTIDNDLYGTDMTIGFDTALNTVMDAVDKIRDTADSHNRLFFIEVMGRDAGFIALRSGIAGGAKEILIPETITYIDELCEILENSIKSKKQAGVILVAEGDDAGGAIEVARKMSEKFPNIESRVTILGHIQRGGSPTSFDRILASTMGYEAVNSIMTGRRGEMIGIINKNVVYIPFEKAIKEHKMVSASMLKMVKILANNI